MILELSFKNMKKRMNDYLIFFFTLMCGVSIFYSFSAIDKQINVFLEDKKNEILDSIGLVMFGISIFVAVILGILIIYASAYFIKRRKKEFALYMLLGMKKRKIALIIILETILIGAVSLFVGILFGIVISQGMGMIIIKMFDDDMFKMKVIISKIAILSTIMYFSIMYIVVILFEVLVVLKTKLINLINASKKGEYKTIKNPYICFVVFLIAMVMLGQSYYVVYSDSWIESVDFLKAFVGVFIGTILLFWSLSGLIIFLSKSIKKFYLRGLRCFNSKEMASRVNSNTISASLICFMLFLTICMLTSSIVIRKYMSEQLDKKVTRDVEIVYEVEKELIDKYYDDDKVEEKEIVNYNNMHISFKIKKNKKFDIIKEHFNETNESSIDNKLKENNLEDAFSDVTKVWTYSKEECNLLDLLSRTKNVEKYKDSVYYYILENLSIEIIKVSDYNQLANAYKKETLSVNDDEYIMMYNNGEFINLVNDALKEGTCVTIDDKKYKPKYDKCVMGDLIMEPNNLNESCIMIVPDSVDTTNAYKYANYMVASYNDNYVVDKEYKSLEEYMTYNNDIDNDFFKIKTSKEIKDETISVVFMISLIISYLGLSFMIISAAILALKTLTDINENKEKYSNLRKIGVSEKMINKSIFTQNIIFFGIPLVLALIHFTFSLKIIIYTFKLGSIEFSYSSIVISVCIISVIHGLYFLLANTACKKIIRERK